MVGIVSVEGAQTEAFGTLLRRLRRDADLTQEELAERAGLGVRTISDLERGISQAPYPGTVQQLVDALNPGLEVREALQAAGRRHRRGIAPETISPARGRLPLEPNPLVGREQDEFEAVRLFRRPAVRLLTLTGVGGVGKTRLALRLASTMTPDYSDGAVFVHLAGVRDAALVPSAIAEAIGVRQDGAVPLRDRVLSYCAPRQMLLILDNFEHLMDAALLLSDLLALAPELSLLVTSRVPLHLQGEHELSVPPLRLPGRDGLTEGARSPAVDLFLQRALAVKPDLELSNDMGVVAEICQRLDGLPLAIELAAARVKVLSLRNLLARLDRRLPLLTGGARDLPLRHQTMRDTIAWSYDLLSDNHQRIFRCLSVFAGGCDLQSAEDVNGDGDVLDAISVLVDHSLLVTEGNGRFSMLETVREYGLEQLAACEEAKVVRERHVEYLLALAQRAERGLTGVEEDVWLRRLENDHDNIRAALQWTLDIEEPATGLRLAGMIWRFWYGRGHFVEGERWLTQLLQRKGDVPDLVRAAALYAAGALAFAQSNLVTAIERWTQALALFRTQNDRVWIGTTLNGIGAAATDIGDYERAAAILEESLALKRESGDPFALAATLNNLANVARYRGRYRDAEQLYNESLTLYDQTGVKASRASTMNNLALVALELGDIDRAEALSLKSLELYQESESVEQRIGCRINLADVAKEREEYARAQTLYEECVREYMEIGDPGMAAGAALGLGELALVRGDLAAAEGWADESDRLLGSTERRGTMRSAILLGDVRLAGREVTRASTIYHAVLIEADDRGMALVRDQTLLRLGWTAAAEGQWEEATLLCAAAERLLRETGATWDRFERERTDAWLNEARRRISVARFEGLYRCGEEQSGSLLVDVLGANRGRYVPCTEDTGGALM